MEENKPHEVQKKETGPPIQENNTKPNIWWNGYYNALKTVDDTGQPIKPWYKPRKFRSDIQMFQAIVNYFENNGKTIKQQVDKKGVSITTKEPMTKLDLIHSLGMTGTGILPYKRGDYDDEVNNFSSLLSWAWEVIESDTQKGAMVGAYNDRMALRSLEVNHGWNIEQKISIENTINYTSEELNRQLVSVLDQLSGYLGMDKIGGEVIDVDSKPL